MSSNRSLTTRAFIHTQVSSTDFEVPFNYSDPILSRTTESNSLVPEWANRRNNFEFANHRLTTGWNDDNVLEYSAISNLPNIMFNQSEFNLQDHHSSKSEFEINVEEERNEKSLCKLKNNRKNLSVIVLLR